MKDIRAERTTAVVVDEVVVFLISMRIKVLQWPS